MLLNPVTPTPQVLAIDSQDSASGARVLKLTGPLTIQTLFDFQAIVREETVKPMILDFSGVPYMDSAGLGSVINAYTACQRTQRGFAVTGIIDRIKTLFAVTHVDGILPTFETLEAAEASIQGK